MLPPELAWMDWDGWRWISPVLAMGIGVYFGWDARGHRWRERAAHDLVAKISTFTDPRLSSDSVEEMEVWAQIVAEAKRIAGDNSEPLDLEDEKEDPDAC